MQPLSLSEQYNLHGGVASLSSSAPFAPFSSSSASFAPPTSSSNGATTSLVGATKGVGVGGRGEMGVSGMLKPSQMFGNKFGSRSHDETDADNATPSILTHTQVLLIVKR